jgi:hypothetical protein
MAIKFTLPVPLSNNNEGQSRHWSKAAKCKQTFGQALIGHKGTKPAHPQRIVITRILGKGERLWDADSVLRGSAKQLIDSLVDAGYLIDDGPKYLVEALGRQDASRRKEGPAVEVEISEA